MGIRVFDYSDTLYFLESKVDTESIKMKNFKFFQREIEIIRWRSANGDVTCIHDMSTQHVRNIIRCLAGNGTMRIPIYYDGRFRREWFEIFRNELERRSEQI